MHGLDERTVRRLYAEAKAEAWSLSASAFRDALERSVEKAFAARPATERDVERYLRGLHLADLALASACLHGSETAWEHLIREYRSALYRAADAIDASGRSRELADALYADLYGTTAKDGRRRSLFQYFHGRSSLLTWLRSVLAQRYVDALRSSRRFDPLPEEETVAGASELPADPDRQRYHALVQRALEAVVAQLDSRDRLRLSCYYAQQLTLAAIGRLLHEHEATVSRQLAKTRQTIRQAVEQWLAIDGGLRPAEVTRCLEVALEDPGPLDLGPILAPTADRKIENVRRSKQGAP